MIRHDDPAVAVHAVPARDGTPLAELLADFDPEPDRRRVAGELEPRDLGDVLPRGFLRLAEWRAP